MWESLAILNVFNTLTLRQVFWKTKIFFKKLGYRFLVESTKIENASFGYKAVLLEANINTHTHKKNREYEMELSQKQSFASNNFIFLKIMFQFQNLL